MSVVWRVYGSEFDVDTYLDKFPFNTPNIFRKGEPRYTGSDRVDPGSGFNLCISESSDLSKQISDVIGFFEKQPDALVALRKAGVQSEVDFAMYVGGLEQYTQTIKLFPEHLHRFAEIGVAICISAYPTSEE